MFTSLIDLFWSLYSSYSLGGEYIFYVCSCVLPVYLDTVSLRLSVTTRTLPNTAEMFVHRHHSILERNFFSLFWLFKKPAFESVHNGNVCRDQLIMAVSRKLESPPIRTNKQTHKKVPPTNVRPLVGAILKPHKQSPSVEWYIRWVTKRYISY